MPLPSTCIRILLHYESIRQRLRHAAVDTTCFTNYSRFHHHLVSDIRQIRSLKSSATAPTLLGFLPSTMTSPTSAMGSTVPQPGTHAPEIQELYQGNKAYMTNMSETSPGLLQSLANNGQSAFSSFPYFKIILI
jgi:hypothetical protein